MKLEQPFHVLWFIERYSFEEKKERLSAHLEKLDECLKQNIIYPHITNLEHMVTHQRLLYGTTNSEYIAQMHPRYCGKRHAEIRIKTNSEFFQEILRLIEWSQPQLINYLFAFKDLHAHCLDQILLIKENESKTIYWGSVYQNAEKIINFERIKINDRHGVVFSIPKNNQLDAEELRYRLIAPDFPKSQFDKLIKQKLFSQLKEDLFI